VDLQFATVCHHISAVLSVDSEHFQMLKRDTHDAEHHPAPLAYLLTSVGEAGAEEAICLPSGFSLWTDRW